MSLEFKVTK